MVKLTPDLVYGAAQYTNPCKERQLDLRGEGEDIILLLFFWYLTVRSVPPL